MSALVVLFNLKKEASKETYEKWAQTTDVPTVKGLSSVDDFKVYQLQSIMGGQDSPPYAYCEVIDINNMEKLGEQIANETMQRIAAEFQEFADNPIFIISEQIA